MVRLPLRLGQETHLSFDMHSNKPLATCSAVEDRDRPFCQMNVDDLPTFHLCDHTRMLRPPAVVRECAPTLSVTATRTLLLMAPSNATVCTWILWPDQQARACQRFLLPTTLTALDSRPVHTLHPGRSACAHRQSGRERDAFCLPCAWSPWTCRGVMLRCSQLP